MSIMSNAFDEYLTDPKVALAVVKQTSLLIGQTPSRIVEPSAGGGAFISAARRYYPNAEILAFDVQHKFAETLNYCGASRFSVQRWQDAKPTFADLVIGNPPFSEAEQFISTAWDHLNAAGWIVFIFRLGLLGGAERARTIWDRGGLRYVQVLSPRPSFDPSGATDNSEYAVYSWDRAWAGPTTLLKPLLWK